MAVSSAVRPAEDGAFLDVKVSPSSPKTRFPDTFDEWRDLVTVRVAAQPEDGRANRELLDAASRFFDAEVSIVRGHRKPRKRLWIGLERDRVVERLNDSL